MGQVPAFTSYLVIGDGRVARHFRRYFEFEALPFYQWSRKANSQEELQEFASKASHVLFLISDRAIAPFLEENTFLRSKVCIHMSGALVIEGVPGAHPLMTFSDEFYGHDIYRSIPFVIERGAGGARWLLPKLPNPSFEMPAEDKGLYHAFCVLAGNFTVLLWEKVIFEFEAKFGLPKKVLLPYLRQTAENIARAAPGQTVLTGPLIRGDQETISKNLAALGGDAFEKVYQAFIHAYRQEVANEVGPRLPQNEVTR